MLAVQHVDNPSTRIPHGRLRVCGAQSAEKSSFSDPVAKVGLIGQPNSSVEMLLTSDAVVVFLKLATLFFQQPTPAIK